jgi:hypothetical protein
VVVTEDDALVCKEKDLAAARDNVALGFAESGEDLLTGGADE